MSRRVKKKNKVRYYHNTRNNRGSIFDNNRGEEIQSDFLRTPARPNNKAGRKSSNVYPLTSRPLDIAEQEKDIANEKGSQQNVHVTST